MQMSVRLRNETDTTGSWAGDMDQIKMENARDALAEQCRNVIKVTQFVLWPSIIYSTTMEKVSVSILSACLAPTARSLCAFLCGIQHIHGIHALVHSLSVRPAYNSFFLFALRVSFASFPFVLG